MMKTALVVDDDPGTRAFLRTFLESEGFDVAEAETGKDAIAALRRGKPDVILVDYHIPDGDGLAVIAVIADDPEKVPTVLMRDDTDETGGAAVPEWVVAETKPISSRAILPAIARARTVARRRSKATRMISSMCEMLDAATREVRALRAGMA